MGRRGPVPKPTWLKVLEGNPGKRPLKQAPTKEPKQKSLACPDWLDSEATQHWKLVAPTLQKMGLLTELDLSLFAVYCKTYANWARVERLLKETGLVYVTPNGQARPRPELAIAHDYMDAILEFSKDFGMTPASRARMNLPDPRDPNEELRRWNMVDD